MREMTTDLKKFEQTRKTSIANTIGSSLRVWVEELWRAVGWAKYPTWTKKIAKNQISRQLDKYENTSIEKHKNTQ